MQEYHSSVQQRTDGTTLDGNNKTQVQTKRHQEWHFQDTQKASSRTLLADDETYISGENHSHCFSQEHEIVISKSLSRTGLEARVLLFFLGEKGALIWIDFFFRECC
jgi:hypothetical protein